MMMAVATAAPMLRAAPPIITTAAIAASAARGILHASAEIVADLSFPRLLFLRRLVLSRNCRVAFGRNRFRLVIVFMLVIELGGRSNHAFGFGVGFFFLKLVLFRFGSGGHCFALFFAFDGVVYRASGFIGGGKASFLRVALGFFFASLGDVLSQDRGFFRTQLGRSVLFVRGFGIMKFGLVVLDRKLGLRWLALDEAERELRLRRAARREFRDASTSKATRRAAVRGPSEKVEETPYEVRNEIRAVAQMCAEPEIRGLVRAGSTTGATVGALARNSWVRWERRFALHLRMKYGADSPAACHDISREILLGE